MFKKFLSITLSLTAILLCAIPAAATCDAEDSRPSVEEILDEYHERCLAIESQATATAYSASTSQQLDVIKNETIDALWDAGYAAYDVNAETYSSVEGNLKTDLSALGLDSNSSYIVVVAGEGDDGTSTLQSRAQTTPSFTYTYNGYTHTMRYIYVTATDFTTYYAKSGYKDLLTKSTNATLIQNCLNSAVSAVIDAATDPLSLGTIASICGLNFVEINTSSSTTLILHANANWVREYTQIYEEDNDLWLAWSSVDYVVVNTYMSGDYYSTTTNSYENVPEDKKTTKTVSAHYNDTTWRKNKACIGWYYGSTYHDFVGDVKIYYAGSKVLSFYDYTGILIP